MRDAVDLFTSLTDQVGLAKTWHMIGTEHFDHGHAGAAESAWEQALEHAQRAGVAPLIGDLVMCLTGAGPFGPTPVAEALRRLDDVGPEIAGQPYREAFLLRGRASLQAMRGDCAAAQRLAERGRLILQDLGLTYSEAIMGSVDYDVALRHGDYGAAEAALRADDAVLEKMGERWSRSTVSAQLAHVLYALDDAEGAQHHAELARELASSDDVVSGVLWRSALAKVRAAQGDLIEARRYATEAVALAAKTDWLCLHGDALMDLAEVHRIDADLIAAASAVEAARALYAAKGDVASVARTTASRRAPDSSGPGR